MIYLDLFRGLGLKLEDLPTYDTPLVGFDKISLPVNTKGKEVIVNFIVVNMDSCFGNRVVHPTCEGEISYRRRNCCSKGRSTSCKTMFSSHQLGDQVEGTS